MDDKKNENPSAASNASNETTDTATATNETMERLGRLQMLMHRASLQDFMGGRAFDPHRGQGRVLAILKMKPEISQRELTYLLGMSKQALAELLAKLQKSGYITRKQSEEDKRLVLIKLTEEGEKAANGITGEAVDSDEIFACLDENELAALNGYLDRLIKSYEEQFPDEDFDERRKMLEEFMAQRHGRGFGGHAGRMGRGRHGGFGGFDPTRHCAPHSEL